jgi:hypothetical protein
MTQTKFTELALSMFRRPAAKSDNTGNQTVVFVSRKQCDYLLSVAKSTKALRLNPDSQSAFTYQVGKLIICVDTRREEFTLFVQELPLFHPANS